VNVEDPINSEPQGPVASFLSSIGAVFSMFVDLLYTRVELLLLDVQDGVQKLLAVLVWSLVGLMAAATALLLGALTLIFAFWETHRVLVAGLITALFAVLALVAFLMLRRCLKGLPMLFAATLEEFAKDREHLRARTARASEP
jgi:uncharacterized membrane protein YqjE